MLAKVFSYGVLGIEAYPIEIEVDIARGLPALNLIGLVDTTIKESRERVKAAIKNSGFSWPAERITINLAPSDIKKDGAGFDLPIALGILAASGQISAEGLKDYCILGELSLDGELKPTRGILAIASALAKDKLRQIILPRQNAREAGMISQISVWPLKSLKQSVEFINNPELLCPFRLDLSAAFKENASYALDFAEIKGQYAAKRAIEVGVCGGHNLLLIGPPGAGKTMLSQRIPTIMPSLELVEALEITKIHSVAGTLPEKEGIIATRPFRFPHHTISDAALVGGGSIPQPGEISLAHRGVLFLDELAEFPRNCLEALRQPLEEGTIRICRIRKAFVFPASFMLVAAMNPCPCGYFTDPQKPCRCNSTKIQNYMAKISGPLLDRIDMHIEMPAIKYGELSDNKDAEPSAMIRARIEKGRAVQRERLRAEGIFCNSQMNHRQTKRFCAPDKEGNALLKMAMTELNFSARAYDKILKVARTVSDLAQSQAILPEHIAEAIQYRSLDRQGYY